MLKPLNIDVNPFLQFKSSKQNKRDCVYVSIPTYVIKIVASNLQERPVLHTYTAYFSLSCES